MANYVHNRILCNDETASHLLINDDEIKKYQDYFNDKDSWYSTIDFRKALDIYKRDLGIWWNYPVNDFLPN